MSNNIQTLRAHLFAAMEGLKSGTMEIDKAKAMSEIAQTIINSAKVEVEYAKATGASGSSFLEMDAVDTPEGALPKGITGIRQYRLK